MLRPLITASQGFPALEQLAEEAQDTLYMSFRIFDPETRLHGEGPRSRGLETWADLLAETVARGVKLRLLLADFDPFFTPDLHRLAWASANRIHAVAEGDVQVLCAPHGQAAGWLWRLIMRGTLRKRVAELRKEDRAHLTPVEKAALKGAAHLRPVTIHQKFAIADGVRGMIGGLDINERRYDTPNHERPPEDTWHDVSMRIDGGFCTTLQRHFIDCWNRSLPCGQAPDGVTPTKLAEPADSAEDDGGHRLLRTLSTPCPGISRLGPRPEVREIEAGILNAVEAARDSLYIETQFLRHRPVIDALVAAAERPGLDLILILPPFAERVLFDGDTGWDARHAHALQARAIMRLQDAFGARCAIIAPAQPRPAPKGSPAVHGAGPVYVHSKVMLVDDRIGIVGSANLNGRSLRWDTEASVRFDTSAAIEELRQSLAQVWLGESDGDISRAAIWRQRAEENAALPPDDRRGFVLPYPLQKVRRFSRLLPILPDDMF
ncbi:phospholipase D family protein [Marinovum sp.]|uniref:phospholipase D-like domain-containing protein n=1 Tax=Marinovum sp. TaxID=2024839 RepID=UPI002B274DE5|nr:phospholipase D family protein [Marinovum sp.]